MSCIVCAARKDEIHELEQRLAVLRGLVDECEALTPTPADTDLMEAGSPDWHSFHHTGEGQHHECDWDVCVEWSARRASEGVTR